LVWDQEIVSSNLAAPTPEKPLINSVKGIFSTTQMALADNDGSYFPRKPLIAKNGYPYIPARLVSFTDPTKQWYIQFRVWDVIQEKMLRKRVMHGKLADIKNIDERTRRGEEWAEILTMDLHDGAYSEKEARDKEIEVVAFTFNGYTLINAMKFVMEKRGKEGKQQKPFLICINHVTEFLQKQNLGERFLLRRVNRAFVDSYLKHLTDVMGIAPKTYNVYVSTMHNIFEVLRKTDHKLFPNRNPFADIEKQRTTSRKHAAYSNAQLAKFKEVIEPTDPQLMLFLHFIYFTLARPKEIMLLKVGHIRMDIRKILFSGDDAKTDIEEYVGINDTFAAIIESSGILKASPNAYVFTQAQQPGMVLLGKKYFYKRFCVHLEALEFRSLNPNYTMYSFKHSGAIGLFLATKDPYLLQTQLRHTTLEQTQVYLKDLGVFTDHSALNKWKGF